MAGISRGAPDKVTFKVRGDGTPLHGHGQEAPEAEAGEDARKGAFAGLEQEAARAWERAKRLLPGGVNSPVRAMTQIGRDPIFVRSAKGAEIHGEDGRTYLDWVGSWGPMILGHADPGVIEAVTEATARGTSFGAPTLGEVELAAEVAERMPSVEQIRMTSSGTEAAMTAIRLARAITGRETIVKFAGAYHGHSDGLLAEAGSGVATHAVPSGPGVPAATAAGTVVVPWNDRQAVTEALEGHQVAALIAEPIAANMGVVPPEDGYLQFLRDATAASGALLIFDEVITGFRVARGGAQELYGIHPDLTVMGKIIGGGLPAAAVGGPARHLERLAPAGDVYQAGTLSGNPLAVAAGLATLNRLDAAAYARIEELTRRLVEGLDQIAADAPGGIPLQVGSAPGLVTLFFSERPVTGFSGAADCDREAHARFCRGMLERGIWLPPSQFEAWFVSLAHDQSAIDRTLLAVSDALAEAAA